MQLRLFLLPVSLSPTSQILVPQSSQQPLLAITYIHIYIHTHNGMSQSLQGCRALPESSGVHMYVHNAPSGVPACTHTYTHTYINRQRLYMGRSSRRPFLTSAHSYVHTYVHMYITHQAALCGGSLEPHARASLPLCTPAPQVVCI